MDRIRSSEITDRRVYVSRRAFIGGMLAATGGLAAVSSVDAQSAAHGRKLTTTTSALSTSEKPNAWDHITSYNNFYEFGTEKDDPARVAPGWRPRQPWTVSIEGECAKPGSMNLEDMLKGETLEDRVYRHRCVEGWSMVIPWVGFPLSRVIQKCAPTTRAKYIEFTTLMDPRAMPGQRVDVLQWPYVEGLRLDEAMHPLTILAVGVYGEVLPNQNGAPLRLVVPWKYGFKGAKSIVRIRFTQDQPTSSWTKNWPEAYGFYSNVNPRHPHPRHSQAMEARLPSFFRTTPTQPFNGYRDQVARLYTGMDLDRFY